VDDGLNTSLPLMGSNKPVSSPLASGIGPISSLPAGGTGSVSLPLVIGVDPISFADGVNPVSFSPGVNIWPLLTSDGGPPPSHAVDGVGNRIGLMGDNLIDDLMIVENESIGDADELVKSGDAEVGMEGKLENFVDPSLQVEAMVRLLEEGLDRLKISADVISISPEEPHHHQQPTNKGSKVTVLGYVASPCHNVNMLMIPPSTAMLLQSVSDDSKMTGPSGSVHPNQITTIPPPNLSSFHKLDKIIRELTKKAKVGLNPQDLISLTLLSDYNILREHLRIDGDPIPDKTASLRIALCKPSQQQNYLTKGPWFARRLREMANHVLRHHQLPERRQGKGGKHSSLLDQKEIYAAVEKFMNDSETGMVCLHLD
jgi:hypothetical protein